MNIKELIEELQKYDENTNVEVACTYDCGCGITGGPVRYIVDKDEYILICNDDD